MSALIGDKGYDGDDFRAEIVDRGAKPVIPNKSNRVTLHNAHIRAQRYRALFLPPQGFQACRNSLRQTCQKLLGCRLPRRHRRLLDQLSLNPSRGLKERLGLNA